MSALRWNPKKAAALRAATESALIKAGEHKSSIQGAINWGDLGCVDVEWYEMDSGICGWRVYVEEASPDAFELVTFIGFELAEAGFPNTEVRLEW